MLGQRVTEHYQSRTDTELYCASAEPESFLKGVPYLRMDITDKSHVKKMMRKFYPDVIINCAAYTNVDKSETEKELAWRINVTGLENLVHFCLGADAKLVTISSDYIFNGVAGPYTEKDKPDPLGYYGRTKLAGENVVLSVPAKHAVIRTNVLYGIAKFGRDDFVKWVVKSLTRNEQIKIVTDQINNPTYVDDLVSGISKVIEFGKSGIFNIGGPEFLSRYEFTLRIAKYFKLNKELIIPILTHELNQPARRPLNSGLINLKAETEIGYKPHSIENSFFIMKQELEL